MSAATNDVTLVGLGRAACRRGAGTLAARGVGGSVAVLLHDSARQVGGLAHVGLPSRSLSRDHRNIARFAETAVPDLLREVEAQGADRRDLVARLVGGAVLFGDLVPAGALALGQRNLAACRAVLGVLGVPVVGEAVGGSAGRAVTFDVARGTVTVSTVHAGSDQL